MTYPDINKLYSFREFSEIYTNAPLIEENVHMKRYQILPVRYMSPENEAVRRFLIYHSPGTGKSFTVLWIILNFINVYNKPSIILVKSKESIMEFTQRIKSWYSYTFSYYTPPPGVNNYQQFIKKYIEFHTYITFCKSIVNENNENEGVNKSFYSVYDERLIIVDEVHHFRNAVGNKIIYNKLLQLLNHIDKGRILFMSATPIFDNFNEITNLVKLIKPNADCDRILTVEKLEEIMRGHLSYYGLNPPDTSVNFIGTSVPGIQHYKIVKIPMQGVQLENYRNLTKESINICNIGINYVKATLGVVCLNNNDKLSHDKTMPSTKIMSKSKSTSERYILKNDQIIHSNPFLQNIIKQQSSDLKNYCCKLYHCLEKINSSDSPDGPVFIYCNIVDDVGIYYFSALLCSMGYNYVYNTETSIKYGNKSAALSISNLDCNNKSNNAYSTTPIDEKKYSGLKEMREERNNKSWNFTFITGDKRLCSNMIERLNIFNDSNNKNGSMIKVLLGSDILSESVDIMNVRQLHILTPHWNYEKINQIIGRIRRVGSHDSLPPDQRFVNIYLYMAYDDNVECSNSITYSIDYVKYMICEKKYKEALKYNRALQNASIESLVHTKLKNFQKIIDQNNKLADETLGIGSSEDSSSNKSIDGMIGANRITYDNGIIYDSRMTCANEINNLDRNFNSNKLISIPNTIKYSLIYLNKILPKYLIAINKILDEHFSLFNISISVEDLMCKMPMINSFILPKLIEFIQNNNIVVTDGILGYSSGIIYRKISQRHHFNSNYEDLENIISKSVHFINDDHEFVKNNDINSRDNENSSIMTSQVTDITAWNIDIKKEELMELENKLKNYTNNINEEIYKQIINYSYTELLDILKYALKYHLVNIKNLFYPYWKEYNHIFYISYFSCIKNTSYASNKKRSVDDFASNIIYSDRSFKEWVTLNNTEDSENISNLLKKHYDEELKKRINHRCKYVYMLCNDFTLRYCDLNNHLNYKNQKSSKSNNLRNIKRGRNIENIYNKEELLEMIIYSICYDDIEKSLTSIDNYGKISANHLKSIFKENDNDKNISIKKYILKIVTNDNVEEYCNKRPYQAYLLYKLLSSFSTLIKMTRVNIIKTWKEYLFEYNLIVIL